LFAKIRKKEKIVKTRIGILMLVLGCLIAISVYAAEEDNVVTSEAVTTAAAPEEKTVPLETETDKVSYIIGTQFAASIRKANIEVTVDSLLQGLKDALEGNPPKLTKDEMNKVYGAWQQKMRQKQAAEQAKAGAENLVKGNAFLEANKAKEGVKVTESGLQYKIIKEGTGKTPTTSDKVKTHYRGRLIDGKEFDSSYKRGKPAEFPVTGVIKGWTEALQLMKEGAKWELYIPANLAYGAQARPGLPANSTLIFEIELLEVMEQ
jgi:FKBP-type peptidyl-prolyl cis-trans isomerase FklB